MEEYVVCVLCGLNRATLHLDEVIQGTLHTTAHLCDDCWYRLGIRIPLGNIWKHINRHKQNPFPPMPDPVAEVNALLADEDLGELLDPGSLAVAEPDEHPIDLPDEIEKVLRESDESKQHHEPPLQLPDGDLPTPSEPPQKPGMEAVHIGEIHSTLVSLIPMDLLQRCKAIPIRLEGSMLTVAIADPFNSLGIANLEMFLEQIEILLKIAFADEKEILRELDRHNQPPRRFGSLS
ncbi:MAG: hypothetical protein KJ050_14185 [Candidatus Omnitrophica bacterium]|nr:hypothetical protein [bacterium]MBK7497343.1 hypothetical protein [Candidatus Omnitrophota bacterium]MBV6480989.1 hypothetical protein [bacterium]MBW7939489.1 hypothetical protein [Candidatus Omnitrophota bacterium]MCK6495364.1 hypothetical protein [bacterium]